MIDTIKIIQVNLNRSWMALDLLKQYMYEMHVTIAIVSEPPKGLKESNTCFLSEDGCAAILWKSDNTEWRCRLVNRDKGFVLISLEDVQVMSCYISPNVNTLIFSDFLDNVNNVIKSMVNPYLICGDFNAHAVMWGSHTTNRRGELVMSWSAALDLRLLNRGSAYTCVRPQGCSIVDLSLASSGVLDRVGDWSVLEQVETFRPPVYCI